MGQGDHEVCALFAEFGSDRGGFGGRVFKLESVGDIGGEAILELIGEDVKDADLEATALEDKGIDFVDATAVDVAAERVVVGGGEVGRGEGEAFESGLAEEASESVFGDEEVLEAETDHVVAKGFEDLGDEIDAGETFKLKEEAGGGGRSEVASGIEEERERALEADDIAADLIDLVEKIGDIAAGFGYAGIFDADPFAAKVTQTTFDIGRVEDGDLGLFGGGLCEEGGRRKKTAEEEEPPQKRPHTLLQKDVTEGRQE